jgi:hypothetical protein
MRSRSGRLPEGRGGTFDVVMTSASRPTFPASRRRDLGASVPSQEYSGHLALAGRPSGSTVQIRSVAQARRAPLDLPLTPCERAVDGALGSAVVHADPPVEMALPRLAASAMCVYPGRQGRPVGPDRFFNRASADADHDFAESASLTDMSQRGGNLVECERTVDVDPYSSGNAEGGKRLEVGRTRFDYEHPERASSEPANRRAGGEHAQQRANRPTYAPIGAARCQRTR